MFKRLSFQLKLQLTVAIVGLIGLGFIGELAFQAIDAALYGKQIQLEAAAQAVADKVDRTLFERYGDVQAFALSESARSGDTQRITAFMKDMMIAYAPIYDTMMVLDSRGKVIAVNSVDKNGKSLDTKPMLEKDYSHEEWFKLAIGGKIKDGTAHYTDVFFDADVKNYVNSDGLVLAFTAPIKDPKTGEILGVWSNRMSWKDVVVTLLEQEAELTKTEKIKDIVPMLVNSDGVYLHHPDVAKILKAKRDISDFKTANKKKWFHVVQDKDSKFEGDCLEAIASSGSVSTYPGQKWYFSMEGISDDDFVKRIKLLGLISIFALLGANIVAYFVIRSLSKSIDGVIEKLHGEAVHVSKTAVDVTNASATMAEAATEQAAALQETAASIEEINAMIKKSSDNADRSQSVATQSSEIATKGKNAVDEMSRAINEINASNENILEQIAQSNKQISEIAKVIGEIGNKTKVINEIVFQTKLLSFNASVEAARAGEHGKGFAVVAEEVGNLAQMSGNAAKEISDMLSESIKRVESIVEETKQKVESLISNGRLKIQDGVVIAKQCSEVLNEVVENVSELNDMVKEISIASKEQAQGVSEITKAVNEMDKTTHGNATTSRQVSGFAGELSNQADSLNAMVEDLVMVIRGAGVKRASQMQNTPVPSVPSGHNVISLKPLPVARVKAQVTDSKKVEDVKPKVSKLRGSGDSIPGADDPRFKEV